MSHFEYQGHVLREVFTPPSAKYLHDLYPIWDQMDFEMPILSDEEGDGLAFREALNAHLNSLGWKLRGDISPFKGMGIIGLHSDPDAAGDRLNAPQPNRVYNACLLLKIIPSYPSLDDSPVMARGDRPTYLDLLVALPPEEPNVFWSEGSATDQSYRVARFGEGQIVLFDQNLYHGIHTNWGYWLMIFQVEVL